MAMRTAAILMTICSLPACSIPVLRAQTLEHVAISQVVSSPPAIKGYLDVGVGGDAPAANLDTHAVAAWLDGKPLPVESLKPFAAAQEGVAYVFLVDVSGSESRAEFGKVKQALLGFVDHMGANDRAAIISFGSEVRDVEAFTGDKTALKSAITGLANNAPMTHLNAAIVEGLRLARIVDTNLPSRRSMVILSDGKDEGSGLTTDDVLGKFEDGRVPIYAIGASNLPGAQRAQYLEVLHRFAVLSGGAYYEATPETVNSAYSRIYDRIAHVWVGEFDCSSCPVDGRSYPLQVRVTVQGQSLEDKTNVAMSPPAGASAAVKPAAPIWERFSWPVYAGAGALVIVLIGLGIWQVRRRSAASRGAADSHGDGGFDSGIGSGPGFVPFSFPQPGVDPKTLPGSGPGFAGSGPGVPDNRPGLKVELIRKEVRSGTAPSYTGKLADVLVIGRGADAGIQIPDSEISGRHCKLEVVQGLVLLSDIGSTFGTAVNGVPIKTRHKIESGDWIALGKVEFRIRIQK